MKNLFNVIEQKQLCSKNHTYVLNNTNLYLPSKIIKLGSITNRFLNQNKPFWEFS